MVLQHLEGGTLYNIVNYKNFNWTNKLEILIDIINGIKEIHKNQMVHRNLHTGSIYLDNNFRPYISDMSLCKEIHDKNNTVDEIYGIMPYMSPEVLRGNPYTRAADIYSFSMIMYFIATGNAPFFNSAHDHVLVFDICDGIRPELNEPKAPKCYIDLMKRCWDSNPDNRPNANEITELLILFIHSYTKDAQNFKLYMSIEKEQQHYEIQNQFEEAEQYKSIESKKVDTPNYTSRLLSFHTKEYDETDVLQFIV
jgi:serine/threonine protein kinase